MFTGFRTVGVIALVVLAIAASASLSDEWHPLFNGKDLSGWRANNDPGSFTVQDGVLRVQASGATSAHLFYVGDSPATSIRRATELWRYPS